MRNCRQRLWPTALAVLIAGAIGAACGWLLGKAVAIQQATAMLTAGAASAERAVESRADQTRDLLAAMNASPYPSCSAADLDYLRRLLYQSSILKDAGRVSNGAIVCSAVVGSAALARLPDKPGIEGPGSTKLYWDVTSFRLGNAPIVTVQSGKAYVVADFRIRAEGVPAFVHVEAHPHGDGRPEDGSPAIQSTGDGVMMAGGKLYATQCSKEYPNCATASVAVDDAMRIERSSWIALTALCTLVGAALGLLWDLIRRRNGSLEQQLRRAIAKGEIQLKYQPIVNVVTRRLVGAEALARWKGGDGIPVGPEVFVRIAEERRFMGELTRYVLNRALDEFAPVVRRYPHLRLSVNVAASDFSDPRFPSMLAAAVQRTGVPRQNLVLELTEMAPARREEAIETIRVVRQAGHQVHIDDFGTGYSSLSYLNELDVDAIKIDRSFTRYIGTDSVNVGILPQILAMAEALNLLVIVEGIETPDQAAYFMNSRTPVMAQGWLFGRPAPIHVFMHLIAAKEGRFASERVIEDEPELALPSVAD